MKGSAGAEFEEALAAVAMPPLYKKRWQVVAICLDVLVPILPHLRQVWDQGKFLSGGDDGHSASEVEAALKSELFISYLYMVHGLHQKLRRVEQWLEGCACHTQLEDGGDQAIRAIARKRWRKFEQRSKFDCPLKFGHGIAGFR